MATVSIPSPPGWPILGNITDIDKELPIQSIINLADQYGSVYKMTFLGKPRIFISSVALMNEVCDQNRFGKVVSGPLEQVRNGTHDGLFTAHQEEPNWELAHRILIPAFSPLGIRDMFDDMKDIASQLVMKWARHGPSYKIPVTDDFTRLTLDTLALCSMDYRFNSFYKEEMHPFVDAMVGFLSESGQRANRPGFMTPFYRHQEMQYWKDIEYMRKLSLELVQHRKDNPEEGKKDLLNAMISGKDAKTGEKLSTDNIVDQMITFLIAGHETTSGLLSFAFYFLIKNPEKYRKAQEEVDSIIGDGTVQVEHLTKLPYLNAVLRETLRLEPTAPAISMHAKNEKEILGGKYEISKDDAIVCLLPKIHRDPAVYGEDANEWKPERMLDENFSKLPPNSWKPFGNGMRACIGRPFAWQEALLVTAMLLQYFNFSFDDASYNLHLKQTLTIKPKDFYMRATLRHGRTATELEQILASQAGAKQEKTKTATISSSPVDAALAKNGKPITVLYGSNTGTCQAFAQRLAADAPAHGFYAAKIDTLDAANQNLPSDQPVVIITASYEGAPCDNAGHFFSWLESLKESDKTEVSYAVFGAGHSDWKQTFHRIPTAIDNLLNEHGGKRICERGGTDAAHGDMFSDFENWEDQVFWPAVAKQYGGPDKDSEALERLPSQELDVEVSNVRTKHLRADVSEAKVLNTRVLTAPGVPPKRHIEIQLPTDMTYSSGDYLAVLPINPPENVQRVMRRFGLAWDSILTISAHAGTILPANTPISAQDLFGAYVELSQPATRRNVAMLADACKDSSTKAELQRLSSDAFASEISEKRVSLLDLLDRFHAVQLPLGNFISSLPPMRTRSYSISSSSLWNPHHVTLTYAVLDRPSLSGHGRYVGVASNYLSSLQAGDTLHVSVRPSNQAFHLPADAEKTPVIMIAAGTGLAPFRGFVQERAAQVGAGRSLAPALLFLGCRDPEMDELYRDEFDVWERLGAVDVVRCYSRRSERSNGRRYVQDAILAQKERVVELWERGSKVFVCGSRELEQGVRRVSMEIAREEAGKKGKVRSERDMEEWFEGLRNARFATDVFS